MKYIYEFDNWPHFTWNHEAIELILGKVRHLQGEILGHMGALGFSVQTETLKFQEDCSLRYLLYISFIDIYQVMLYNCNITQRKSNG